jgi:predicted RNA-binding Zn-ribbon protein involved in translation (DUF1610 family)
LEKNIIIKTGRVEKEKETTSKTQFICPNCKGNRIKPANESAFAIYGSPDQRYVCDDCGYIGSLIIDSEEHEKSKSDIAMEEDLMKIKKELGL